VGEKPFYESSGYKIIDLQEVDLEEQSLEVILNDFESLLLE
jgi:hypothetical protein